MVDLLLSTSAHLFQKLGLGGSVPWFELFSSWSWSIHLMVQWCSNSYWWFLGVCEMSQPSWGVGPAGSPPHAWMPSFHPLIQLLSYDDIGLSRLQRLFDLRVSVRFCEHFPACRGHSGIFISHVLPYYCISPDDYSRHRMYVGFIMLFI